MTRSYAMRDQARRFSALLQAVVLAGSALVPIMLLTSSASADQLQNRFIDMSATQTSAGSGRDGTDSFGQNVTYTVSFDLAQAHTNLEGIVVDFCSNSPLIGTACTGANGIGLNLNGPTVGNSTGDLDPTGWATTGSDSDTLILSDATGLAGLGTGGPADNVTFDITGITNPTSNGTFYARIITYTDSTVATAYDGATVNANNPGVNQDDGGIALAVANELTVTARVQEVLEFCVGTADAASNDDCTDISGTDVDLGVVDASAVNTTTGTPAYAMVRTNGFNGASVYYKAEQDNGDGKLKISGVSCTNNTTELDQCFNSAIGAGSTSAPVGQVIDTTTSGEAFGMTLTSVDVTNGVTTNLSRDAAYDGDGSTGAGCTAGNAGTDEPCWAWADSGVFDTIANSTSVVDDEMVTIAFAAVAAPTTPTGLYTTTANFVATATF